MKQVEKKVVEAFNKETNAGLILKQYEYARFDAFNDFHIVEVKYRHKWYDDMLIEFDKYSFNLLYAHLADKSFLYIVAHHNIIMSFNITNLTKVKYDFKWEWRKMPSTTEFSNADFEPKFVGYLDVKMCEFKFELNYNLAATDTASLV